MYTAVLGITWQACWHSSAVKNVRVCPFTGDTLKNAFISKQSALPFLASKKENEQVNWLNWHSCPNLTTEKTRWNFFTFLIVEAYLRLVQVCPERAWLVFFLPLVTLARDGLDFSGGAAAAAGGELGHSAGAIDDQKGNSGEECKRREKTRHGFPWYELKKH